MIALHIVWALAACDGDIVGAPADAESDDAATPGRDAGSGSRFDAGGTPAGDAGGSPERDGGAPPDSGGARTYTTSFDADENPISEGGAWSAIARPWLRVRTVDGVAKADDYVTGYNDNYTRLSGFGPDVEITATVFIEGDAPFGEILLLARMDDTAGTLRGYEFLYDGDGSVQLMRWNGGHGDFTPMGGEGTNPGPLRDHDQLRMRIVGSTITIFHRRSPDDWVEIGETTDTTFADGQPGFGFFVRNLGQTIDAIGLRDYSVTEIR